MLFPPWIETQQLWERILRGEVSRWVCPLRWTINEGKLWSLVTLICRVIGAVSLLLLFSFLWCQPTASCCSFNVKAFDHFAIRSLIGRTIYHALWSERLLPVCTPKHLKAIQPGSIRKLLWMSMSLFCTRDSERILNVLYYISRSTFQFSCCDLWKMGSSAHSPFHRLYHKCITWCVISLFFLLCAQGRSLSSRQSSTAIRRRRRRRLWRRSLHLWQLARMSGEPGTARDTGIIHSNTLLESEVI